MSFKPMFEFTNGEVQTNAQRFATEAEALSSAQARFMVWMMPTAFHVEPSDDPVTYRWDDKEGDISI